MTAYKITVKGLVQGIGYRPFVAETAESCGVGGWVRNTDGQVTIIVSGETSSVEQFLEVLQNKAPAGAFVEEFSCKEVPYQAFDRFVIAESDCTVAGGGIPRIPADLPTCEECLRELHDPENRRYRHPFISCTACGPRYSIIEHLPYDRETITMKDFPMCEACGGEYRMQGGRRRHAQTIACKECGPKLKFVELRYDVWCTPGADTGRGGCKDEQEDALDAAVRCLKLGGIVAVKDIGGYHLVCTPFAEDTVACLRLLKGREKKPFAVMFPNLSAVKEYCLVSGAEEKLLLSPPRPIVLLKKQREKMESVGKYCDAGAEASAKKSGRVRAARFAENVCGTSPDIGAMLPCNPVQTMLTEALGPLIMTSANASGELLILDNAKMEAWMRARWKELRGACCGKIRGMCSDGEGSEGRASGELLLGVLSHDRPILTPLDDSIVRVVCGRTQTFRRGRGYVPEPILVSVKGNIFAAGGDLKACFCYTAGGNAYLSQHLGDLAEEACFLAYQREKWRMQELFGFVPERTVCDLHPGYVSARECKTVDAVSVGKKEREATQDNSLHLLQKAYEADAGEIYKIQHHEAHVASVIAEHGLYGNVLGFAFDGTGYGRDQSVWGSEAFFWDGAAMKRVAHLKPVRLIGGDEGAKNADTIFYGYLSSFGEETRARIRGARDAGVHFPWMEEGRACVVEAAVRHGIHTVESSSMGRLFDAVSAFLDICHYNGYEGEAAIELENLAATAESAYPLVISCRREEASEQALCRTGENEKKREDACGGAWVGDAEGLFLCMLEALENGVKKEEIARGFIYSVADFIVSVTDLENIPGTGLRQIVLSGGTFQNRILLERTIFLLEEKGYEVSINEKVPCGDGGICLGQAYLSELKK